MTPRMAASAYSGRSCRLAHSDRYLISETIYPEAIMSLQAQPAYTVPEETARVARAIFPHGNQYVRSYDTFGSLF